MSTTTVIILLAILYIITCVLNYGYSFSYFQHEFALICCKRRKENRRFALIWCLTGPIGILFHLFNTQYMKHGCDLFVKNPGLIFRREYRKYYPVGKGYFKNKILTPQKKKIIR